MALTLVILSGGSAPLSEFKQEKNKVIIRGLVGSSLALSERSLALGLQRAERVEGSRSSRGAVRAVLQCSAVPSPSGALPLH